MTVTHAQKLTSRVAGGGDVVSPQTCSSPRLSVDGVDKSLQSSEKIH